MSNIRIELNRTTRMLGRLFPAILAFTPAITSAGIIEQSTSVPQDFSADTEYVINKDVTISSSSNKAAVSVSGIDVTSVTNKGNISGAANGLDIKEVAIKWSAAPDMTPQTVLYRRPVAQFSNFQP
ncbi:hypothetical protein AAHD72_13705, partial [Enterobacter cloacae]